MTTRSLNAIQGGWGTKDDLLGDRKVPKFSNMGPKSEKNNAYSANHLFSIDTLSTNEKPARTSSWVNESTNERARSRRTKDVGGTSVPVRFPGSQ